MPPSNHEPVSLHLSGENITSQAAKFDAIIVDIDEPIFTIEIPQKICAEGHTLLLRIYSTGMSINLDVEVRAKVKTVEEVKNDMARVEASLINPDPAFWESIHSALSNAQAEMDKLMSAIKG